MTDDKQIFQFDWISPPGESIADLMEERDWNQIELAKRLGFSTKHLNQLIKGKAALSEDAAVRLERVLGFTTDFWLKREAEYRAKLARLEERKRYEKWVDWLDELPLSWLKEIGVIPNKRITASRKPEVVETLLKFFSAASPTEWTKQYENLQASIRCNQNVNSDFGALASWLRMGEIEAEKMDVPKYNKAKFEKNLDQIRQLAILQSHEFEPQLRAMCSEAGVKLVFVQAVPKSHVSGVARWLNLHSPLIQLSLHEKINDKFWFAFFHEAAHILLHADNKQIIFLEYSNNKSIDSEREREADQWAINKLTPNG